LVSAFGGLDSIYACLSEVPGLDIRGAKSLALKLEAARDDAYLALRLVTLCDTVPLGDMGPLEQSMRWTGPVDSAEVFFDDLGTLGPLNRLRRAAQERL
jgi:DNA polymerase-1